MASPVREHGVADRLRELREASRTLQPSARVEAELMRAFAAAGTEDTRRPARTVRWLPALAASAVLATAVVLLVLQTWDLPARTASLPADTVVEVDMSSFVPVPGAAALPRLESATIVRLELSLGELPAYGVEIVPDAARRAVEADLLIGQDGYARAIRVVTGSTP
jgi:hypothetical protein